MLLLVNDAVWAADVTTGKIIYTNKLLSTLFKISEEDFFKTSQAWLKWVHPEDLENVKHKLSLIKQNPGTEIEHRIVTADSIKWVNHRLMLLSESEGDLNILAGVITDITQRKEAEIKLEKSEKISGYLFEKDSNPLWIYDCETSQFLSVNNAALQQYGYSKEEFLSLKIQDIQTEELPLNGKAKNDLGNTPHLKGWKHIKKDKSIIYVTTEEHGIAYNGRKAKIILVQDITNEIENRQQALFAKNNLTAVINNTDDLIWSIDSDYNLISLNKAFHSYYNSIFNVSIRIGDNIFKDEKDNNIKNHWKKFYEKALSGERFTTIERTNFKIPQTVEV